MKTKYKIVEAIRELLRDVEKGDYINGSEEEFDRGHHYGIMEGLQQAYDKASVIADGFE